MGQLTTIYSCGNDMTSKELLLMVGAIDDAIIDVWYPELGLSTGWTSHSRVKKSSLNYIN